MPDTSPVDARQFIPAEWIGCGKVYPEDDTPAFILAARKEALKIPVAYGSLLPKTELGILDLLEMELPFKTSAVITQDPQRSFSFNEPTEDLQVLAKRPLPSAEYVHSLHKAFSSAWFSGARSVIDNRYKQSRLPLSALTVWSEMHRIVAKAAVWRLAEQWLGRWEREPGFLEEADHARILMGVLPWGARVQALGSDTAAENLALLLSDKWLDDEIVNMLFQELYTRARRDPKLARDVAVLPLVFQQVLHNVRTKKSYSHPLLSRCASLIAAGRQQIFFPVNIQGMHWIPCMVDIAEGTIRYGDACMQIVVEDLQDWLLKTLNRHFADGGNSLAHGLQEDGYSCGICTVNTIEHALFGTELFTHQRRRSLRVRYFNRLVMAHNNMPILVSTEPHRATTSDKARSAIPADDEHHLEISPAPASANSSLHCADAAVPGRPTVQSDQSHAITPSISNESSTTLPMQEQSTHPPKPPTKPVTKRSSWMAFLDDEFSESSSESETDRCREPSAKRVHSEGGTIGISASSRATQKLKESMRAGTLKLNTARVERFKAKCQEYDLLAEFRLGERWQVYHSHCGKWLTMKEAYNVQRFRSHVVTCRVRQKQLAASSTKSKSCNQGSTPSVLRVSTLDHWAGKLGWTQQPVRSTDKSREEGGAKPTIPGDCAPKSAKRPLLGRREPCPGITPSCEPLVSRYLHRTGAGGGGGPNVTSVARELFEDDSVIYSKLSEADKEKVEIEQMHRWAWRNDHTKLAVFATACKKTAPNSGGICTACERVLTSKPFRNALNVPLPESGRYKFLNEKYRNTVLGNIFSQVHEITELVSDKTSTESVFIRFAKMMAQGKFDGEGHEVFLGLIQAMVEAEDREERGVGKQNFNYPPALLEFAHTCAITCPEIYRSMQAHLQLPDLRTLGRHRAKLPPFPTEICDRTFEAAKKYIQDLGYGDGPVALSCDDTKLHAAWRTYYDREKQQHFLVGGTGPPRAIADIDELRSMLKEATETDKATKLRLWCLQPTLPKIPPIIVAAKAIPNSLSSEELYTSLIKLLNGLIDAGINVTSYACDGTETERSVQKMLIERSEVVHTHVIKHPAGLDNITVRIAVIHGRPIVIVQDSKHGAKTFCNNACSGARAISLGNFLVLFSMLYAVAFSPDSPLYHRDMEKLDRQDDNAATRLYASATLDHIIKTFPDYVGLIVYLFVFGELVDAYQNRSISHYERIKMVLRARFFVQLWRLYLDKAGYPVSRYCISREALDICNILVDECRKLIKDFTHLDFLYMVPRLFVLLRAACRFAQASDPRACANGYAHTYFDSEDANLASLAVFPSDAEIDVATQEAWEEASNLWDLLGVNPPDLLPKAPGASTCNNTKLPSVSSWFASGEDPLSLSESAQLQQLIDAGNNAPICTDTTEKRMESLTCAAIALTLNDICEVYATYEGPSESERAAAAQEDLDTVLHAFNAITLPALPFLPAEPLRPFDRPIFSSSLDADLFGLARIRKKHETERARKGVCTRQDTQLEVQVNDATKPALPSAEKVAPKKETVRQKLIREMQDVLRAEQNRGVGTGLERDARWRSYVKLGAGTEKTTGNSANAELAAGARAAAVVRRRIKYFQEQKVPFHQDLGDALVGAEAVSARHATMVVGSFVLIVHKTRLFIGQVLALYTRSGGRVGFHSSQQSVKSIGLLSYVVVQVFEHSYLRKFRAIHEDLFALQTVRFLHIPADNVLLRLPADCTFSVDKRTLEVDATGYDLFTRLSSAKALPGILEAVKLLTNARRRARQPGDEEA
ncbi:hypothetical protein C8Q78DRAFT_977184 [Trametes maxima]|nr:hypothetical protein C8Q78DRAFT_977184 [Trametes maxima]